MGKVRSPCPACQEPDILPRPSVQASTPSLDGRRVDDHGWKAGPRALDSYTQGSGSAVLADRPLVSSIGQEPESWSAKAIDPLAARHQPSFPDMLVQRSRLTPLARFVLALARTPSMWERSPGNFLQGSSGDRIAQFIHSLFGVGRLAPLLAEMTTCSIRASPFPTCNRSRQSARSPFRTPRYSRAVQKCKRLYIFVVIGTNLSTTAEIMSSVALVATAHRKTVA